MDQPLPGPARPSEGAWDGYYINLDRSLERRSRMDDQLRRLGLAGRYRRFAATDGQALGRATDLAAGAVGCFRSHLDLFEKIAAGGRPAHIVEDDMILCDVTAPAIDELLARGVVDRFDLFFLETDLGQDFAAIWRLNRLYADTLGPKGRIESPAALQVIDLGVDYLWGSTSYLVTPAAARRMIVVLEREWASGPTLAIDQVMRAETQAGRWTVGCVFPFVTAIHLETGLDSTATPMNPRQRYVAMLRQALRYSFFVDRNVGRDAGKFVDGLLDRLGFVAGDDGVDLTVRALMRLIQLPETQRDR